MSENTEILEKLAAMQGNFFFIFLDIYDDEVWP